MSGVYVVYGGPTEWLYFKVENTVYVNGDLIKGHLEYQGDELVARPCAEEKGQLLFSHRERILPEHGTATLTSMDQRAQGTWVKPTGEEG